MQLQEEKQREQRIDLPSSVDERNAIAIESEEGKRNGGAADGNAAASKENEALIPADKSAVADGKAAAPSEVKRQKRKTVGAASSSAWHAYACRFSSRCLTLMFAARWMSSRQKRSTFSSW